MQHLTEEETGRKKQKRSKKSYGQHNAITGFEAAFEQFAKAGTNNPVDDPLTSCTVDPAQVRHRSKPYNSL